jgi:hypothetical protein
MRLEFNSYVENLTMSGSWHSESSGNSRCASPWKMNGAYLSEIYDASLDSCNEFISEFCHHIKILYGSALAERMEYLSLDERNKQLIGMLRQLGNDDFLATLDGMTTYRLMNVDLESLLSCFELDCSKAINLCTRDGGLDLHEVCRSVEYIYGENWCLDFQQLVTCLTRSGKNLPEALGEILTHKHGLYYEWRRAAANLETTLNLPRSDMWDFDDTPTDATDRKVSVFKLLSTHD